MKAMDQGKLEGFLEAAGLDEEPLGMFYTESFSNPMSCPLPSPGRCSDAW